MPGHAPDETAWRRFRRAFARAQTLLGIPLIAVLLVLHIGLDSTSRLLEASRQNAFMTEAAMLKASLSVVQAQREMQDALLVGDAEQLHHAAALIADSARRLREPSARPGRGLPELPMPMDLADSLQSTADRISHAADAMALGQPVPSLDGVSAALASLHVDLKDRQLRVEEQVASLQAQLTRQLDRYVWAVRATLLLLLALYASLTGLHVSQGRKLAAERAAREVAERAARARSDFLAVMSHEIRTPLNGVIGVADLIGEGPLTARQREYVEVIRQSGGDLLRLIDDILDFSRIDAGQTLLDEHAFDLRELVAQLRALLAGQNGSQATLDVSIGEDVPGRIVGDRTRYAQVIGNLLKNAMKYAGEGEVMLDIDATDREELVIRVRDTGAGMEPGRLEGIERPSDDGEGSIIRTHGGTGLGLPITRRLVDLMQGEITVRSVPGQGTEFMVHLPLRRMADSEATTDQAPAQATPAGLRVLLVEDNPVNQMVTRRMLESLGHRVEVAIDGQEGVAMARTGNYQLVLMDLQMPRMSGITATAEIRRAGSGARIVALSANALPEHRQAAREAGMDGFLAKPARLADLERLLGELFGAGAAVKSSQTK